MTHTAFGIVLGLHVRLHLSRQSEHKMELYQCSKSTVGVVLITVFPVTFNVEIYHFIYLLPLPPPSPPPSLSLSLSPRSIQQNIHTGTVQCMFVYYFLQFNINHHPPLPPHLPSPPPSPSFLFSPAVPAVGFEQSSYSVAEGSSLPVTVISNASVPDGVVQLDINDLTAKGQNYRKLMIIIDCQL